MTHRDSQKTVELAEAYQGSLGLTKYCLDSLELKLNLEPKMNRSIFFGAHSSSPGSTVAQCDSSGLSKNCRGSKGPPRLIRAHWGLINIVGAY